MDTRPFFSIVIPVYNGVTNDLPKCLNSIWEQSLDKELYEVICIDDCSTDNTRQWLKEQREQHSNLRIVENEKNIRQGGARNKGVKAAKGKYICFIDQDDYYHQESITQVYEHLKENNLEILIVDCAYQSPGIVNNKLQHNFPHREIMTGDEQIEKNSIPYAPWKFVFLKSLMIDNNHFFSENERIEDIDWVHKLTHYATRTQYQPILMIHYNKTSISTTMTAYSSKEIIYSSLRLAQRMNVLINTTFENSNDNVKNYLRWLLSRNCKNPITCYFFFYDKCKNKSSQIIENISNIKIKHHFIVKLAIKCPTAFSYISNLISPFGKMAMYIYRKVKYIKK